MVKDVGLKLIRYIVRWYVFILLFRKNSRRFFLVLGKGGERGFGYVS